jgi:uncharacterized membrane protein YgaE (UPF0421/DUF939 family)
MMNRKLVKYIVPLPDDDKMVFDAYIGLTAAMIGNKYMISEPLILYRNHNNNVHARIDKRKQSYFQRFENKYRNKYQVYYQMKDFL